MNCHEIVWAAFKLHELHKFSSKANSNDMDVTVELTMTAEINILQYLNW